MRDWESLVKGEDFTNVMRLIHLAMRMDSVNEKETKAGLVKARRRAYESELTIQARRVGCNKSGKLTSGPSLTQLDKESQRDAESIVNTYNYDLARAILRIAKENPRANRKTYVKQLQLWEGERAAWKAQAIAVYTDLTGRRLAQQDFMENNGLDGVAVLEPTEAVEEICMGWIKRGEVPLREAMKNPPPYHGMCPHYWVTYADRAGAGDCADLWTG